ncbi:endolytic transglycosylase MltG [bacterium]|nr:endolytic transglycosylase MltG [bacterium]
MTPTPIANPSENTLRAVLQMKSTNYLFYLHDSQGNIHYAETNEGHVKNKNLYL